MTSTCPSVTRITHDVADGELGVADAVVDEGDRAAVRVPAVGLDDEAVRGPVEVGDVAADRVIGDGLGDRRAAQRREDALPAGARGSGDGGEALEDGRAGAAASTS